MHLTTPILSVLFFFNDTATTEIYPLSLHDALPISLLIGASLPALADQPIHDNLPRMTSPGPYDEFTKQVQQKLNELGFEDRKSTRLNSSHLVISYAVFCLKKKKTTPPRLCTNAHLV